MPVNVSASGIKIFISASYSYPQGFTVTQLADDSDPFAADDLDIASATAAINGDVVVYSTPVVHTAAVSVIPNTLDADNLDRIAAVNTVGKDKIALHDIITMVVTYADGTQRIGTGGSIIGAPSQFKSTSTDARITSRTYRFAFETVV